MAGRRLISGRQALGIEKDMREGLYAHLLRLSFGFYDRHQTGQLMSRATVDLQSVRFFLGFGLIFFFQHVLTIVSVMVVLFVIEWRLALIALAITPLIVAVAYRYSHVSHPVLRDVQQKLGDVATVTEESIVGVHVVKAFAQEERRQPSSSARRARSSTRPCAPSASGRSTCRCSRSCRCSRRGRCCSWPGGWSSTARSRSSEFFVFNLLLAMLIVPLRSLGMWIGQAQRATAVRRADLRGDGRAGGCRGPARRDRASRTGPARSASSASSFAYAAEPAGAARHRPRRSRPAERSR